MKRRVFWGEVVRFGLVGVFATAFHYGLYLLLRLVILADVAYALGYFISFVANFYLTARFTFGTAPSWRKFWGMSGAHGVNFLLHLGLFRLFSYAGIPEVYVPFPVYAVAIPVNFLLVRFVFRKKI